MSLTTAQQATLAADITANSAEFGTLPHNSDGAFAIAAAYNLLASPTFVVWKASEKTEMVGKTVNYVAVEAMTDINRAKITTFNTLNPTSFEPSRSDIRIYWDNTFAGALGGQGQATRDALQALWRRNATRAEKLFATGTGTTAVPATLTFEGALAYQDIMQSMGW